MPPPESAHFDGPVSPEQWAEGLPPFQVTYDEGVKVGYKWYDAEKKPVLFPFGYGLSYTTYSYSGLTVTPGDKVKVTFTVANTGARAGAEIAEVYAALPASAQEPPKRLVGWSKVKLEAGEKTTVDVGDRTEISVDLRRSQGRLDARPRRLHHPGRRLLAGSSAKGDTQLKIGNPNAPQSPIVPSLRGSFRCKDGTIGRIELVKMQSFSLTALHFAKYLKYGGTNGAATPQAGCGKAPLGSRFVTGLDFSRAASC